MKKRHIPVLIAIILIFILVGIMAGAWFIEKYSYSKERADLNTYFGIMSPDDTALIFKDEVSGGRVVYKNGHVYFPLTFIDENIDFHFFHDEREGLLLYTNALGTYETVLGSDAYSFAGEFNTESYDISYSDGTNIYIAADYLKKFSNFDYAYYENPGRVVLKTEFAEEQHASSTKDTWVRELGGIKSNILCDLPSGTEVKVLETMDEWSKVETADGFIGYTENKVLSDITTVTPSPADHVDIPTYPVYHIEGKVCLVWNMVTNTTSNSNADSLLEKTKGVNVISPTWYAVNDNSGSISSLADPDYVNRMHSRGIQVWALLDNFTNNVDTAEVVNVTTNRRALINNILDSVLANNIDGINVDFENVTEDAAGGYIQFLRELSVECHKYNIILSADNSYLVNYSKKEQGEVVDYVIIMGYDEHVSSSDGAGSVASIGFVQSGIERALENADASKVINGVPFYTRLWALTGNDLSSKAYSMVEIQNVLADKDVTKEWDSEACQNYVHYTSGDTEYSVWLEDAESLRYKLDIMNANNLAGVAGWRLGQEDASAWDAIAEYLAY